jgi:hypothetical protein
MLVCLRVNWRPSFGHDDVIAVGARGTSCPLSSSSRNLLIWRTIVKQYVGLDVSQKDVGVRREREGAGNL